MIELAGGDSKDKCPAADGRMPTLLPERGSPDPQQPRTGGRAAGHCFARLGDDARRIQNLRRQWYAEALRRGLEQAQWVLIVADGAVWIWNLAEDRFAGAQQRPDFYHASKHL